jgi:hypothetical protein
MNYLPDSCPMVIKMNHNDIKSLIDIIMNNWNRSEDQNWLLHVNFSIDLSVRRKQEKEVKWNQQFLLPYISLFLSLCVFFSPMHCLLWLLARFSSISKFMILTRTFLKAIKKWTNKFWDEVLVSHFQDICRLQWNNRQQTFIYSVMLGNLVNVNRLNINQ